MKVGLLVLLLSIFIIFQAAFGRMKKNRIMMEKSLLRENFDKQLLLNKVEVQEATINEIGKELHDNVNQLLSTAKMFIGLTERALKDPPATLLSANEALDEAILELRNVSKSLNKEWIEKFDLKETLVTLIQRLNLTDKLRFNLQYPDTVWLSPPQQFILFRLLQEAISNILRHAGADTVGVTVTVNKKIIKIVVADNGKGFDISKKTTGLGINIMRQRAKAIGASIQWESGSAGTKVNVDITGKISYV